MVWCVVVRFRSVVTVNYVGWYSVINMTVIGYDVLNGIGYKIKKCIWIVLTTMFGKLHGRTALRFKVVPFYIFNICCSLLHNSMEDGGTDLRWYMNIINQQNAILFYGYVICETGYSGPKISRFHIRIGPVPDIKWLM